MSVTTVIASAKLAKALADLIYAKINKKAKKRDQTRALIEEMSAQFIAYEARIARLERFTKLLDMDQDQIPDALESLVQARLRDVKNSGLELR